MTDGNGEFFASPAAVKYSLFIKEQDGYFANIFDGENIISSVTVVESEVTKAIINVNYQAYY